MQLLTGNCLLLPLNLGCTTNQRSISVGYLLQLLVHSHQGPLLCFMESSLLKNLVEKETRGQEIPQWLMYRHSRRPFWKWFWIVSASLVRVFFFCLVKSESSCLETTLLSAGLSEFHIIRHQITGSMLYMLPSKYAWPPRISMSRHREVFF